MPEFSRGNSERVRDLCRRLKPILGEKMEQLYTGYCAEDAEGKKQVEAYLEVIASKYLPSQVDKISSNLIPPSASDFIFTK